MCEPGQNDPGMFNWTNFDPDTCLKMNGTTVGDECDDYFHRAHYPPRADIFLMSAVLMLGTFTIAYSLKGFRTSRYLPTKVLSWIKKLVNAEVACWKNIPLYYINKFGLVLMLFNSNCTFKGIL